MTGRQFGRMSGRQRFCLRVAELPAWSGWRAPAPPSLGWSVAALLCAMLVLLATVLGALTLLANLAPAQAQGLAAARAAAAVVALPPPAAAPWRGALLRASHAAWGLDAPVATLAAQVHQESGWRADAISRAGAQGMAQFMPATATWWCSINGLQPAQCQPQNPQWALRALAGYDAWLHARLTQAGDDGDRWWATLRAYNGGLGHWQAEARQAGSNQRRAVDAACGTARRAAVHCAENLGYPQRIIVQLQPRYSSWGRGVRVTP